MIVKNRSIIITTYNVNGMRDDQKRLAILTFLKTQNPDFIFLQETHAIKADEWRGEWEGDSKWSPGTFSSRGCAILGGIGNKILSVQYDPNGRYVLAKAQVDVGMVFNLVCVYAPDKPNKRVPFFKALKNILIEFCGKDPVILGGDLNFVEDPDRDRMGTGLQKTQFVNGRTEFDHIAQFFDLRDTYVTLGIDKGIFTWSNKKGDTQSRLDRIYVSETGSLSPISLTVKDARFSDHKILQSAISITEKLERGQGYWKLNTAMLNEMPYKVAIRAALATELEYKGEISLRGGTD